MNGPTAILEEALRRAERSPDRPLVNEPTIERRIETIIERRASRSGARLLLAGLLAKIDEPTADFRQALEVGSDLFLAIGRHDDVRLTDFLDRHRLPCGASLFPVFGLPKAAPLFGPDTPIVRRRTAMFCETVSLLVDFGRVRASSLNALAEAIRRLVRLREVHAQRIELFRVRSGRAYDEALSSDAIVALLGQHLACRNASRLPVLMIAAAYRAVGGLVGEGSRPLLSHNAADEQTGAVGDVEIHLVGEDHVVTAYEMKLKPVARDDVDRAVTKVAGHQPPIQKYLFVTTEAAEPAVHEYAASIYDRLGVEMAILDCLGFVRHVLHFFHRHRMAFLEAYQELLLAEPESAVRQELKEAFLTLRMAAETGGET